MHTLGMYFSGKVSVLEGQHIAETGLYERVRHPAYAWSLQAYLGMGPVFTNSISFVLIFFPVFLAALYRIRVEETASKEAFGDEYNDYSRSAERLVPGVIRTWFSPATVLVAESSSTVFSPQLAESFHGNWHMPLIMIGRKHKDFSDALILSGLRHQRTASSANPPREANLLRTADISDRASTPRQRNACHTSGI